MIRAGLIALLLAGCMPIRHTPPVASPPTAPAVVQTRPAPTRSDDLCGIIKVVDGDTIKVRCAGQTENLRLMGFDTPETYHSGCAAEKALGNRATAHLERLINQAQSIRPVLGRRDKYRRILAELYLDGQNVADLMVGAGLAVRYHGERRISWCDRLGA